jgi:hypothetical protein
MSDLKHTPGPWFMEAEPYDSYYQISDDFSTTLAQVEAWDGDNDEEVMGEAKANARLIAAAPELLQALEGMLEIFVDSDQLSDLEDLETVKFARATILKIKAA